MTDHSFFTVTTDADDNAFSVRYCEPIGMIVVGLGDGKLYMPPVDAATLVDQITAALNAYTSTLRAVA
ncbi:hypothetical protein AB0I35_00175 [Nocardia sp. NPDC050378]|uniref:hypothetical protein n=1 Tax=Nocardia sp. NPDC050378 TaxID=3155400 RepID=UPI0033C909C1